MPATRSRTENWKQTLQGVFERGGAIEIALPRHAGIEHSGEGNANPDLIWRVRILGLSDAEIIIEQPSTLGQPIRFQDGIKLVAILAIGQNRWMFHTENLGRAPASLAGGRNISALRLRMPITVERCQRRNFYRISTVGLSLPIVDAYTLLDQDSAILAEATNRREILDRLEGRPSPHPPEEYAGPVLPQVGPRIAALLVNIGGGGAGLLFDATDRGSIEGGNAFWLRVALTPHVPVPLCVSARLKHTHIDSAQRLYAGMSFEFGHHVQHQKFVVDQLLRYVAQLQRDQLARDQSRRGDAA